MSTGHREQSRREDADVRSLSPMTVPTPWAAMSALLSSRWSKSFRGDTGMSSLVIIALLELLLFEFVGWA